MIVPYNYTDKVVSEIAEKLKDDSSYYGEYGKQWLSNSDIKNLLDNPRMFGKPQAETKAMLEGRYFHTAILEKDKLKDFGYENKNEINPYPSILNLGHPV